MLKKLILNPLTNNVMVHEPEFGENGMRPLTAEEAQKVIVVYNDLVDSLDRTGQYVCHLVDPDESAHPV